MRIDELNGPDPKCQKGLQLLKKTRKKSTGEKTKKKQDNDDYDGGDLNCVFQQQGELS